MVYLKQESFIWVLYYLHSWPPVLNNMSCNICIYVTVCQCFQTEMFRANLNNSARQLWSASAYPYFHLLSKARRIIFSFYHRLIYSIILLTFETLGRATYDLLVKLLYLLWEWRPYSQNVTSKLCHNWSEFVMHQFTPEFRRCLFMNLFEELCCCKRSGKFCPWRELGTLQNFQRKYYKLLSALLTRDHKTTPH